MAVTTSIKPLQLVGIDSLRPGMWFNKLGGSGFHPVLVRRDFLLSECDIEAIRLAGIREVWIDTNKGLSPDLKEVLKQEGPVTPSVIDRHQERLEALKEEALKEHKKEIVELKPVVIIPKKTELMHEEVNRAIQVCEESKERVMELFADARLGKAIEAESIMHLVDSINESVSRHPDALLSVARLKTHDEYTYMHSVAVCGLMVALSQRLALPEEMVQSAGAAGMLHDLGKAVMPLHVLNKPGALTEDEFKIMKAHPIKGLRC